MSTRVAHLLTSAGVASVALVAFACAPSATSPMDVEASGATNYQPQDRAGAAEIVAQSRCRREETCGNVGEGKPWDTRKSCQWGLREQTLDQVPPCSEFDAVVLDECLQDIRTLRCAADLSTVANVESCRAGRLCRR